VVAIAEEKEEIYMMVLTYTLEPEWWQSEPIFRSRVVARLKQLMRFDAKEPFFRRSYKSLRHDCDLIFWLASRDVEALADFKLAINKSVLGFAQPSFSMLSLYEDSPYLKPKMKLSETLSGEPLKYFIAYPMSKDPEWYLLDFEERRKLIAEHIGIARAHPEAKGIRSYTTYSFGLGDQEFVVLYETDSLIAWSHVTQKLREAKARKWITEEAPIFVGITSDLSFLDPGSESSRQENIV